MKRRLFLILWIALPVGAQLPAVKIREIDKAVSAEMTRQSIPGLSVAVANGHELRWSNGYGMSDLENLVPAKASTVFRLGSISKPITAVAALQLVERHRLALDAPVQQYVPSFPQKPWPITARLLLGHLSGIRHYRGAEIESTRHYYDLLEPLKIFRDDPLLFEPGTHYSYTTYGYILLGAMVEAASGQRFMDYVQERIFRPAGMDHIRADDVYAIIPHRTRGYRKLLNGEVQNCGLADTSNKIPGGGMASTPEDLVKFALAVEKGVLLKKETIGQMFATQRTKDGKPTSYGLGWNVRELEGKKHVGHGGGQQGTSTLLSLVPEQGLAVAIMSNLEGASLAGLAQQIEKILVQP